MTDGADTVLIRFGEIGLKDRNRGMFESALKENIRDRLADLPVGPVKRFQGGLEVRLTDDSPVSTVVERLRTVAGIVWFAPVVETDRTVEDFYETTTTRLGGPPDGAETFAVRANRSDKGFFMNSVDIEHQLGGQLQRDTGLEVDLDDPDWTVHLHVLKSRALLFEHRYEGPGGLPVGTAGNVLCLLSGGIDSPVASIMAQNRGCRADFLHFYAYPEPERALQAHLGNLAQSITPYGTRGRLFMVPYAPFDLETPSIPKKLQIVLFRRHILRVANQLADEHDHQAFVTGDSLGQVASQTMENLTVIGEVADRPILRPVIGLDKNEIVERARRFGTFEASTRHHQDCCSLNDPHPDTRADLEDVRRAEREADIETIDQTALEQVTVCSYSLPEGKLQVDTSIKTGSASTSTSVS